MSTPDDTVISILTVQRGESDSVDLRETRSMFPFPPNMVVKSTRVAAEHLAGNLSRFISLISPMVEKLPEKCGAYDIDELNLSLAVDAAGGISLIGELSLGLSSSINITLKKRRS